jgi:uncharacterized protein DUF5989
MLLGKESDLLMEPQDSHIDNETFFKKASQKGFLGELWYFLRTSKKWWMLPLILSFLVMGIFLVLAKTAVAPFIYTLF